MVTTLRHFALISYLVPIEKLRPHIDPRFEIVELPGASGPCGLISVVPFLDVDFRFAKFPFVRFRFGQTNYRVYVRDRDEHLVWFFGTALATPWVAIPRHLWKLPWHRARMTWDVEHSTTEHRYVRYRVDTSSTWAPASFVLEDTGASMALLPGFDSLDEQRLVLTHPERGVYFRRDGVVGSYSVWHPELELTQGRVLDARFTLLERLGFLSIEEMQRPHSVLISPSIEFQIRLPPTRSAAPALLTAS